jgi:hypothetical protein
VQGLSSVVDRAIDTADGLNETAERVGLPAEQLQALRLATEQTGGSAQGLDECLETILSADRRGGGRHR